MAGIKPTTFSRQTLPVTNRSQITKKTTSIIESTNLLFIFFKQMTRITTNMIKTVAPTETPMMRDIPSSESSSV